MLLLNCKCVARHLNTMQHVACMLCVWMMSKIIAQHIRTRLSPENEFCLQVFVLSQKNVKEKGYVTLFQYMTKNKKSLFARVVLSAPEVLQVS